MRIHYLATSRLPSRQANSVQVMKMAAAFARLGHETTLFAAPGDEQVDPWNWYGLSPMFSLILDRRVSVPVLGSVAYAGTVALRSVARGIPDLYYGRSAYALAATALTGRPFIYEVHALPRSATRHVIAPFLLKRPNFLGMVAISDALKSDLLALYPFLRSDQVIVAHDAADPVENVSGGRAPGPFRIGYAGHLYSGKGMEVVAAVAPLLSHVEFHIAGGTPEDIARWKALCPSNVRFHGHLSQGNLRMLYRSFDIAILPAQAVVRAASGTLDIARWMSPMKLFEYMSHGLPILASDLPVLREVLRDGETALLISPADMQAWAERLRSLIADSSLRARLSEAARAEFLAHYTWDARARTILNRLYCPVRPTGDNSAPSA